MITASDMRIALRHRRYRSRAAYVELAAGTISLRLPSLFGRTHRWDIPVGEVVVVDTSQVGVDPMTCARSSTTTSSGRRCST
jgi:hypothetical protein